MSRPSEHALAEHGLKPNRGAAGADLRLRILLSYHYVKDTDLDALLAKYFTEPYPEVFIDSGAFSADTQGVSIDIQDYIAYIKRYRHLITTYSNLDVIRNPEGTWRNQQVMEDEGLAPLPVFHGGTDWSWLEHYIERYPYIALGGLVGKIQSARGWLVRCFQMAKGRAVFHGFGVTAWGVLKDFPWYSVDSSSWGKGFRYGQVMVFDERKGAFVTIQLGDRRGWGRHSTLVRSLGFDPMDFADRSRNDRAKVCAISALSYMQAERWLRRRHGEIRIPARDGQPIPRSAGLRLYLADSTVPPDSRHIQTFTTRRTPDDKNHPNRRLRLPRRIHRRDLVRQLATDPLGYRQVRAGRTVADSGVAVVAQPDRR